LLLFGSYFCMYYVWYFFFAWLYLYLAEVRGFTLLESGFLGALPMLAGAGGAWLGGEVCQRSCDRLGPRLGCRVPVMLGLTGTAVLLTAVVLTPDRYTAVAMLTLCYALLTSTDCMYWQGTTWVAGPYTSSAGGVLNTGGNLAGIVGTPLTALLFAQFGWTAALGAGVVFALLGATLWLFIRVDEPLVLEAAPARVSR
jgi:ACS family glucarate transporter-like MFS transporter